LVLNIERRRWRNEGVTMPENAELGRIAQHQKNLDGACAIEWARMRLPSYLATKKPEDVTGKAKKGGLMT
jgi:hypothetical protein